MCVIRSQPGFRARNNWLLHFGRLRLTPFGWVSPLSLLARLPRSVWLLPCSIIFSLSHPRQAPLFFFQSGRLLTRSAVISLLRDIVRLVGLPFHSLKGHTFRIGAASTAAAVGLPDWLIKIIGRWYFDCYQLYNYKNYLVKCCFLRPQEGPMLLCT